MSRFSILVWRNWQSPSRWHPGTFQIQKRKPEDTCKLRRESSWALSRTCRPSRLVDRNSTGAPTFGVLVVCFTKCCRDNNRLVAKQAQISWQTLFIVNRFQFSPCVKTQMQNSNASSNERSQRTKQIVIKLRKSYWLI